MSKGSPWTTNASRKGATSGPIILTSSSTGYGTSGPPKNGSTGKLLRSTPLSADYDRNAEITLEFFATVQNKLHWAIHGHTAAELITERADAGKPNMGLTAWKGAKVRKGDVTVAKNYLTEDEVRSLNRIVTMYLDYAEDQAQRHQLMYMADWKTKLDGFLQFNGREVLANAGTVAAEVAKKLAEAQYERFNARRLQVEAEDDQPGGDFDRVVKQIQRPKGS